MRGSSLNGGPGQPRRGPLPIPIQINPPRPTAPALSTKDQAQAESDGQPDSEDESRVETPVLDDIFPSAPVAIYPSTPARPGKTEEAEQAVRHDQITVSIPGRRSFLEIERPAQSNLLKAYINIQVKASKLKDQNTQLGSENNEFHSANTALEQALEEKQKELEKCESAIASSKDEIIARENQIEQLEDEKKLQKVRLEELTTKLLKEKRDNKKVRRLNMELSKKAQGGNDSSNDDSNGNGDSNDNRTDEVEGLRNEVLNWQEAHESVVRALRECELRKRVREDELAILRGELNKAGSWMDMMKNQTDELESTLWARDQPQERDSPVNSEPTQPMSFAEELEGSNEGLDEEEEFDAEVKEEESDTGAKEVEEIKEPVKTVHLGTHTSPIEEIEGPSVELNEVNGSQEPVGSLSGTQISLTGSSDDLRAELEAVRAESNAIRAELDTSRDDLETSRAESNAVRAELDTSRTELEAARATLSDLREIPQPSPAENDSNQDQQAPEPSSPVDISRQLQDSDSEELISPADTRFNEITDSTNDMPETNTNRIAPNASPPQTPTRAAPGSRKNSASNSDSGSAESVFDDLTPAWSKGSSSGSDSSPLVATYPADVAVGTQTWAGGIETSARTPAVTPNEIDTALRGSGALNPQLPIIRSPNMNDSTQSSSGEIVCNSPPSRSSRNPDLTPSPTPSLARPSVGIVSPPANDVGSSSCSGHLNPSPQNSAYSGETNSSNPRDSEVAVSPDATETTNMSTQLDLIEANSPEIQADSAKTQIFSTKANPVVQRPSKPMNSTGLENTLAQTSSIEGTSTETDPTAQRPATRTNSAETSTSTQADGGGVVQMSRPTVSLKQRFLRAFKISFDLHWIDERDAITAIGVLRRPRTPASGPGGDGCSALSQKYSNGQVRNILSLWSIFYAIWFFIFAFLLVQVHQEKQLWRESNPANKSQVVSWRDHYWTSDMMAKIVYRVEKGLGLERMALG